VGAYGTDTINFAIAGAGVHTISPTSALPTITAPVVINGYTQPGSSVNTLAVGDNAVLRIEINGTNAPGAAFVVNSAGNTFKGLVINRFFNASFNPGYAFGLIGSGNAVQGCYLGTNPGGDTDLHNTGGVLVESGGDNLIGGPSARRATSFWVAAAITRLKSAAATAIRFRATTSARTPRVLRYWAYRALTF
jgi:hypothetical protein